MTATCREACYAQPRFTISELFERGYRRNRAAPLSIEGPQHADAEGNSACFSLDVTDGKIVGVGFRATTCATLIAYCEYIAEIVPGFGVGIARELTVQNVIEAVPGVPSFKQVRAVLATAAFRAGLVSASIQSTAKKEDRNEGRLHLRHPAP